MIIKVYLFYQIIRLNNVSMLYYTSNLKAIIIHRIRS